MTKVPDTEILIPMGDWNGNVGTDANGMIKFIVVLITGFTTQKENAS